MRRQTSHPWPPLRLPLSHSLPLLLLLLLAAAPAAANIMGVDLGLGYIKVAVARPRRGLELVTNEQSKRKTPAAVAFTEEGERLFGDAAVAYAAKVPSHAILDGRLLIGQCAAASADDTNSNSAASQADEGPFCPRRTLVIPGLAAAPKAGFTGEEVVAMQLAMARSHAAAAVGAPVKDVAVTVPAWFDERQRLAVADAARVVGLNCLGVVNANTAAAIKYALDGKARLTPEAAEAAAAAAAEKDAKDSKKKKKRAAKTYVQRVMFYDVGASAAAASIAEITSDVKTGVAASVRMLAHAWNKGIGGRALDAIIIDRLADAFDKQRGPDATPSRTLPRVMMRLRKEAQRAREVLSANTETIVSVASLHDDLDLRTTLNRADFEADAKSMFRVVSRVAKAALSDAQLAASDLDAVVPFGGASRTPKVQDEIRAALGVANLNKSINTDEAAVMGSAFFAASLSSAFQVRKMEVVDVYRRSVSVEIEKDGESSGMFGGGKKGVQKVEVFAEQTAKMPSKKTVSLNRKNDFSLRIFLELDKSGRSRFPERTLYAQVNVKGVSDVLKKLKDQAKAKTATPRVALVFHIDRSGMVRIGTAESSVDEVVVVEREVEVEDKEAKKKADDKDAKDSKDSDKDAKDEKKDDKEAKEGEEKDGKKEKEKPKKKTKIEKSTQTVVHRSALTIEFVNGEGIIGMQLSGDQLKVAQKTLKDLEDADKERVERADALNGLEGFILEARSKAANAEEDEPFYQVTTEEERQKLIAAFDEAEDWMYTDEAKQLSKLRRKHHDLKKMLEPATEREKELTTREEVMAAIVKQVRASTEYGEGLVQKLTAAKSKRVEDVSKFVKKCEEVKAWVNEKADKQADTPLTVEPAVKTREIKDKLEELRDAERVAKIIEASQGSAAKEKEQKEKKEDAEEGNGDGEKEGVDDESAEGTGNSTKTESSDESEEGGDGARPGAGSAEAGAGSSAGGKEEL